MKIINLTIEIKINKFELIINLKKSRIIKFKIKN